MKNRLTHPTEGKGVLTSPVGWREWPGMARHWHKGIDIAIGGGQSCPIIAAAPGLVVTVLPEAQGQGYGDLIQLQHDGGKLVTLYAHLRAGSTRVKVGDTVKEGQHIADMGDTGSRGSVHLHFEVKTSAAWGNGPNSNWLEPLTYITGGWEWALAGAKQGESSARIRALQRVLNLAGAPVPITGLWGPQTQAAVLAKVGSTDINAIASWARRVS
jgi:murein DD-endopeptidase MepM/ murein hydrolase activator NlpD